MKIKNRLKIFIFLVIFIVGGLIINEIGSIFQNLALKDSSAIYGGQLESSYPYTGYMNEVTQDNKLVTCGATFLTSDVAVSAAHCIKPRSTIYLGINDFKLNATDNYLTEDSSINPEWLGKSSKDISIIKTKEPILNLNVFPEIGTPSNGCHYKVVGYGLNENNSDNNKLIYKPRKSSDICIIEIFNDQALFKGSNGGICYGDSGSPIFDKNTNKIVGIVSSIVSTSLDTSTYCLINNSGIMVRLDSNKDFINSYISLNTNKPKCGQLCSNNICSKGLSCTESNICSLLNKNDCIVKLDSFCSFGSGIGCEENFSCILNKCSKNLDTLTNIKLVNNAGIQTVSLTSDINTHIILIIFLVMSLVTVFLLIFIKLKN